MTTVRQPTKRRRSCVLTLKYTFICVYWWTRQRIHNTLIVVDRYLRLMGDKTIPDSAEPRLESFYPPFVAGIDLPHQGVVDSYNLHNGISYTVKMVSLYWIGLLISFEKWSSMQIYSYISQNKLNTSLFLTLRKCNHDILPPAACFGKWNHGDVLSCVCHRKWLGTTDTPGWHLFIVVLVYSKRLNKMILVGWDDIEKDAGLAFSQNHHLPDFKNFDILRSAYMK